MAKIAMILGAEFEDSEFRIPYDRLRAAGHQLTVIGTDAGQQVRGKRGKESVEIEAAAADCDPKSFDALVIPGGHSPDHLRVDEDVVDFVRQFAQTGRTVAAVCHGAQLLIEAEVVQGRTMTSWKSVKKDLENAGARWVDQEVVRDGAFITSRKPGDLQAFSDAILASLAPHKAQQPSAPPAQ